MVVQFTPPAVFVAGEISPKEIERLIAKLLNGQEILADSNRDKGQALEE
jgi:hypothetical protein